MFSRPEEIIMAILGLLWLVGSYFLAAYSGINSPHIFMITGLTLLWLVLAFVLWQRGFYRHTWPLLLGLLLACWWPALHWIARDAAAAPWYAGWTFKLVLAAVPVVAGYVWKWQQQRRRKYTF